MGKYTDYKRQPSLSERETSTKLHPIWQGVGFGLMILTPLLGYFGALALLEENSRRNWVTISADLLAPGKDPLLYAKIILTVALTLVIFTVFQLFTYVLYRLFGPSRYGPLDVPPVAYPKRRKKQR